MQWAVDRRASVVPSEGHTDVGEQSADSPLAGIGPLAPPFFLRFGPWFSTHRRHLGT